MRKIAFVFLAATVLFGPLASSAYAGHGKSCSTGHCSKSHDCGKEKSCDMQKSCGHGCPITAKFTKKSQFMLQNQADLGLSADQVKTIEALQLDVEKLSLRQEADMKIWMLDLKAKLKEDPIDTEALNVMMEQGAAGMAQSGKASIGAYAKLKGVLSPQQMQKMKDLWKAKEGKSGAISKIHS